MMHSMLRGPTRGCSIALARLDKGAAASVCGISPSFSADALRPTCSADSRVSTGMAVELSCGDFDWRSSVNLTQSVFDPSLAGTLSR